MSEAFLGEIRLAGFTFAPAGWALCNGQLLSIAQNDALYALIGTTYGGDGNTTFALPNLQSRIPVGQGQGPGLTNRNVGELGGTESVTLNTTQMPTHTHQLMGVAGKGASATPANNAFSRVAGGGVGYLEPASLPANTATTDFTLPTDALTNTGGNQPHSNVMPVLALQYIIALQGIFPSRN